MIKSGIDLHNNFIIIDAITDYKIASIYDSSIDGCLVEYEDIEDQWKTLLRFWDWGYKRILPKDKIEIIKPYLKKRK